MNVSEFIEWLKTQDQEAIVQVVNHTSGYDYYTQGGVASVVGFDPELAYGETSPSWGKTWEYNEYKDEKTLLLGVHNG